LKQENQEIVQAFLDQHPDFELLDPKVALTAPFPERDGLPVGASASNSWWQLWPQDVETDGFFAAILQRKSKPVADIVEPIADEAI
jgi:16S rRNA (cytosine967-C5)-methyltransferase